MGMGSWWPALVALGLAVVLAVIDWVAVAQRRKRVEYVAKPATMVMLLAGALALTRGPHDSWQARYFIVGLTLSLAGDVFLMLPGDRTFIFGLATFLLAHVSYTMGLTPTLPPWKALAILAAVFAIGTFFFRRLAAGLRRSGQTRLLLPVGLYAGVLSLMASAAWTTLLRPEWTPLRQGLVIAGASLFLVSDAMLSWDRFVQRSHVLHVAVIITYQLGQMGLAASIAALS